MTKAQENELLIDFCDEVLEIIRNNEKYQKNAKIQLLYHLMANNKYAIEMYSIKN